MERFLRYSLQRQRPIRGMLLLKEVLVQKTFTVLALEADQVTLRFGQKGKTLALPACLFLPHWQRFPSSKTALPSSPPPPPPCLSRPPWPTAGIFHLSPSPRNAPRASITT